MRRAWRPAVRLESLACRIKPRRLGARLGLVVGDLVLAGQRQRHLVQALEQGVAADAVELELDLPSARRDDRAVLQIDAEPRFAVAARPGRGLALVRGGQ